VVITTESMCLRVRLRCSGPTARTSCPHSPARVRGVFKQHVHAAWFIAVAVWHFHRPEAWLGGRCCTDKTLVLCLLARSRCVARVAARCNPTNISATIGYGTTQGWPYLPSVTCVANASAPNYKANWGPVQGQVRCPASCCMECCLNTPRSCVAVQSCA
jgi:hypothetical protein